MRAIENKCNYFFSRKSYPNKVGFFHILDSRMGEITFTSSKGEVKLKEHHGAGNGYHLYIDMYFQGEFTMRKGEWVWLNANSKLEPKEIEAIIKIIKSKHGAI